MTIVATPIGGAPASPVPSLGQVIQMPKVSLPSPQSVIAKLPHIDPAQIHAAFGTAEKFLPFVAMAFPELAPIIPYLPMIDAVAEAGASLVTDVAAKWGDPIAVMEAIDAGFHSIATAVSAAKSQSVATSAAISQAASQTAIDFQKGGTS